MNSQADFNSGRFIGAVLCGGSSSRFGSDKALADFGGVPLGSKVLEALRAGGADPVVAVGGSAGIQLGIPTVPDLMADVGPLAGLISVLKWAGSGPVVVASCDLPLLTGGAVRRLVEAFDGQNPVVAEVEGLVDMNLSCWPADVWRDVQALVNNGNRAFKSALEIGSSSKRVTFDSKVLADTDNPTELAEIVDSQKAQVQSE